ncbi:MAG: LacI family transcriptional regulator [Tissierellia bacterium]|nr:LacI family transcriptional regulator [Tissierellia bacterium]
MKLTIKEIAELANVSTATVSKVLNGKDQNISEATRKRILEIAERVNYRPNRIAKSLKLKKTYTIGLIVPDIKNLYFSEMAKGIEDAAEKKGYSVILCNSDNNMDKEEKYINILQEHMVDGIILTTAENNIDVYFKDGQVPIVLLDRNVNSDLNIGRILVDNEEGGYIATKHLIDKGCKNIAFISSINKNYSSYYRFIGYRKALLESGYKVNDQLIYTGSFSIETGYKGTLELLKNGEVDGIFCGNDYIAIGAIKALKGKNIKVPHEIKIVGFDDILIAQYMEPPITTIRQPIYDLGREAVNMLVSIIDKKDTEMTRILKTELVERGSS